MQKYTEQNTSKKVQVEHKAGRPGRERRPVLPVFLAIMLMASLGIQAYLVYGNMQINAYVADQKIKAAEALVQENSYQEDGFKVAEQYEIKSTKQISDAYISGDESALSAEDKETLNMAKDVLKSVVKDNMSDYEKEEAIYVWMVKNIGQGASTTVTLPTQRGGDSYTPHGVLKTKAAVCVGYATTFRLFMNMLGMDCHIVHNDYHSWDLVQLDDGEWYHTDVYSDAGRIPSYRNFNMSDSSAEFGHDWDKTALPEAKGVKYTTANQKKKHLKSMEEVPADLKKGFDDKQRVFFYEFDKVTEADYPVADYIVTQLQSAFTSSGTDGYVTGMWYDNEDESHGYILGIFAETYDNSGLSDAAETLSEDRKQKLTDAINQAFGTEIGLDPYDFSYGEEGMGSEDYVPEESADKSGKSDSVKSDPNYYADEDGE